eukprot:TRINITY_DN7892_c0_g1_i1.p1 TRINITY_DN7892_c0_g1~~TRINITY_DN7892_c0_g1_i1.p1  ORF type:complete len:350 (-),score=78.18 TRINITY_DN7892_c0_g1_i1:136-1185(-)
MLSWEYDSLSSWTNSTTPATSSPPPHPTSTTEGLPRNLMSCVPTTPQTCCTISGYTESPHNSNAEQTVNPVENSSCTPVGTFTAPSCGQPNCNHQPVAASPQSCCVTQPVQVFCCQETPQYSTCCIDSTPKPTSLCHQCDSTPVLPTSSLPTASTNHLDCDYCPTANPTSTTNSCGNHSHNTFDKMKMANTVTPLKVATAIKKKKNSNASTKKTNPNRVASTTNASADAQGERDSKMAKEMTTVLSSIPGMEKVRWQSIIQSTRGPEVGDRETQRRVKEAEVLVGKVFGGDVRRMLTLLMNEHLDFLVKFVSTTLSTSRRGHKKVRDQVFNALKEIKERESELEGGLSD